MKPHPFFASVASILVVVLIIPTTFFIAPSTARAIPVNILTDFSWTSLMDLAKDTITSIASVSSEAANWALVINAYVLQPLAFLLSGDLLKKITAGVLAFVVGQTNGTGAPQFVQNVEGHLQSVGDNRASAFFVQFGRNSNSPFASGIASSLRLNYLQNTSAAGFFAANRSTLAQYSPNVNAFLAGNWSGGGGIPAWFALTTQTNNNPYTLYQASQSHLASVVAGAQSARAATLNWAQGLLSWCGTAQEPVADSDDDGPEMVGTAPGDPCYKTDGTAGNIQTPGSIIKDTLTKALGTGQDKLVQMGQLANEVNQIMGNFGAVFATVNFATQLLGGSDNSSGLLAAANPNSDISRNIGTSGFAGVTTATTFQSNANSPLVGGSVTMNRVALYQESWTAISSSVNAAQSSLTSLRAFCLAAAESSENQTFINRATAEANAAQSAITTYVAPALAQVNTAFAIIDAAIAMVQYVQEQLNSSGPDSEGALAGIQTLQTMPPSANDIADAQQDAMVFGSATISGTGFNVSGGSLIDRMNLLSTTAEEHKTSICTERRTSTAGSGDNN